MTVLHVGAVLERPPGPKYREALGYAELRFFGPPPKPKTLARWTEETGGAVRWGLLVPGVATGSSAGAFRMDDDAEAAFAWTVEAAQTLDARWLVVRTGVDFTTGQRDRDLFDAWLDRLPAPMRERVAWHPGGLWDDDLAIPFARKRGLVKAYDPTEGGPGDGPAYARLRAIGQRKRFGETVLLDVLESVLGADEAWVTFDSPRSFDEARRLVALASE